MHHSAEDITKIAAALDGYLPLISNLEIWTEQQAAAESLKRIAGPALDASVFAVKNDWQRNINLRKEVSRLWREAVDADNLNLSLDLARWMVKDWGGIKNIRNSTIGKHNFAALNKLFNLKFDHISSKSKVITLPDPYANQIYDARVAVALNVMQLAADTKVRIYFEIPNTQITWIASDENCFKARIPEIAFIEDFGFRVMPKNKIYSYYTRLLLKMSIETKLQLDPIELEMALFALAMPFSHNSNGVLSAILAAERDRLRAEQDAGSVFFSSL